MSDLALAARNSGTRRPRMKRTPSGKCLELSERDFEIFKALRRYRYLSSTYIHASVGGASATRLKERLGDLFHEGFIDRPFVQWEQANCRYRPAVYEYGAGAKRALGLDADDARTFLGTASHKQFLHSLMICEVLASIELATHATPSLRFIPWMEALGRAPEITCASAMPYCIPVSSGFVVPDGLFGLEYADGAKKTYRFFALEADRGTMPVSRTRKGQSSLLGKLDAYRAVIEQQAHRTHWGIPNLLVLTVTTSAERLATILKGLECAGGSPALLFKVIEPGALSTPLPALLTESWQRAGLPALSIAS